MGCKSVSVPQRDRFAATRLWSAAQMDEWDVVGYYTIMKRVSGIICVPIAGRGQGKKKRR